MAFKTMTVVVSVACSSSVSVWDEATTDSLSLLQVRAHKVDYPTHGIYADLEYPKEDAGGAPYCEGIVYPAQLGHEGHSQNIEVTRAACDNNENCMGIKLHFHNRFWYPLMSVPEGGGDGEAWGAWSQAGSQTSVLVKNCDDALILPTSTCGADATEYAEGRVVNADAITKYGGYRDYPLIESMCDKDVACLGLWQHSSGPWYFVVPNYVNPRVFWKHHKGLDSEVDTTFASVRVKSCVTTTTTTTTQAASEAEAVGDPHMVLPSGQKADLCCEGGKCEPC